MYNPSRQQFLALSRKGNLIPVYKEILADLETPVSAYFKIARGAKYSFLLESVEGEEKIARFSFLAKDPELIFQSKENSVKMSQFKNGRLTTTSRKLKESPLRHLREIMRGYRFVQLPELPRFCGGLVGYLSYDVVRYFEKLPRKAKDDLKLPDALFVLTRSLVIFDHRNHNIKVVYCARVDPEASLRKKLKAYKEALKKIDELVAELKQPLKLPKFVGAGRGVRANTKGRSLQSNFTKERFVSIVRKAKEEIKRGEIIQVVLSQRLEVNLKIDPFDVYRELRVLNPSPYMFYLNFNGLKLIGSSPELLVRCEGGIVETRPIAGTRRRGKDEKEDEALARDLLNDAKEKAEHIMLVDLGRNDLGRVCVKGSVRISEFMTVEKYSHVMHIISNVQGKLHPSKNILDVLQAAFPAGTVSGAPKIRAMEIIEDLEKVSRGPYAGCVGYLSFSGNLDTCITIRTIVVKGNKAYIQAGAGIVADSQPQREYQETLNKAKAQMLAIELAHQN